VGAQADQGLSHADIELDGHHSRGLMDHALQLGIELGWYEPRRGIGFDGEEDSSKHIGHHESVGVLVVAESTRFVAVEIEGPDAGNPDANREAKDGAGTSIDGLRGERGPSRNDGGGEIWFCHRDASPVGVDARPFSKSDLQLFDHRRDAAGGAQRCLRGAAGEDHDACPGNLSDIGGNLTQRSRPRSTRTGGAHAGQDPS
jgi:hypothetical protein